MINPKMYQKPAIGIGIAAIVAVLCLAALASDTSRTEKPVAVDAEQYADFIENEVFDIQDLAESAEIQRRMFNRMTPPGFSWVQPMFPSVVPFDAENFDEKFLDELLGEDKNSVAIYPLSLALDPKTRETLVFNGEGKQIAAIPADRVSREWPEDADPARVTLQLDLLPSEDVEPYLYTESRIEDYVESLATKTTKSSEIALRSLGTNEFGFAGIQRLTNGSMQVTVTNGTDAAEVFAYTVWHTSSVSVVVWTNEFDEVLTNSHTAWHPVSPSFDGIESAWECLSTNLPLINGVGVYEDADIPDNARVRFYAVVKLMDTDGDGLSDGAEILVYRTDPDNPDSDGDGLSDYEEVITYGTNPNDPDSDGDGLPDAWEVQHGLDPLDDGSVNINNGPEGDPDGDGFSNSLELELGSPADNPAWNGHQLAYRLTHARANTRSITNDLIGLRVDIDDSSDCGGSAGTQNRTDSLYVPELLDCGYFIDITVEGMVEDVDVNYDKVSIEAFTNTFYFSGSSNRPSECRMISKTKTCNVFIKGNSTVYLRYNTVSYKWHSGAYAEIVGAELTDTLKVHVVFADPDDAGWADLEEKKVILSDKDTRIKIQISPKLYDLQSIFNYIGTALKICTSGTAPDGHVYTMTPYNTTLTQDSSFSELRVALSRGQLISLGVLPSQESDSVAEKAWYDTGFDTAASAPNLLDGHAFDAGMTAESRGKCTQAIYGGLDNTPPNSPLDKSFFVAGGIEVITAECCMGISDKRQLMNQADYFYYSGHGWILTGEVYPGGPSDVTGYWDKDLDIVIFAGCSVLDINDYNNNTNGAAHLASPGKLWEPTGPSLFLGYNWKAPTDLQNSDSIISTWLQNRSGLGDVDAWRDANSNSNGRNACAIEANLNYYYFHKWAPLIYIWTTIPKADW